MRGSREPILCKILAHTEVAQGALLAAGQLSVASGASLVFREEKALYKTEDATGRKLCF